MDVDKSTVQFGSIKEVTHLKGETIMDGNDRNETNCAQNKKIFEKLQSLRKGQINQKEDLGKGFQHVVYLLLKQFENLDHTEESLQSTILSDFDKSTIQFDYINEIIYRIKEATRDQRVLYATHYTQYERNFEEPQLGNKLQALENEGTMLTYEPLRKFMITTDHILRKVKILKDIDTNDYVVYQSMFIEQKTTYIKELGELYIEIIGIIESLIPIKHLVRVNNYGPCIGNFDDKEEKNQPEHTYRTKQKTTRLRYSSALLNVKNLIPIVTLSLEHLKGTLKVLQHMPSVPWVPNFDELLPAIRTLRQKTVISNEYTERLHSFLLGQNERNKNWNNDKFLWPGPLVAAGLSYDGEDDIVVCKYCNCRSDTTRWTDNDENYALKMHREGQMGPCHFLEVFGGAQLNSEDSHAHKKKRRNTKG